jgi:ferredoxin-type protein NapG
VSDGARSRRDLLRDVFGVLRGHRPPPPDPDTVLRPPGALSPDERFLDACTGCGDCLPACPESAILTVPHADGRAIPAIHPAAEPCHLCPDLPCITACPEGALVDPGGPERVRIGVARVDPRRCVTFAGEHCTDCYRACPYPDQAIMLIGGRPLVGTGSCTGCGLCEHACPENPKAIRIVADRHLVPGMRIPKDEMYRG